MTPCGARKGNSVATLHRSAAETRSGSAAFLRERLVVTLWQRAPLYNDDRGALNIRARGRRALGECTLAEGCNPGRRVQSWQKGAILAEGCNPGRRVQSWQKGAILAEGCKRCKKWVSPLHPCTFCTLRESRWPR